MWIETGLSADRPLARIREEDARARQCGRDRSGLTVHIHFNLAPYEGVRSMWIETGLSADRPLARIREEDARARHRNACRKRLQRWATLHTYPLSASWMVVLSPHTDNNPLVSACVHPEPVIFFLARRCFRHVDINPRLIIKPVSFLDVHQTTSRGGCNLNRFWCSLI